VLLADGELQGSDLGAERLHQLVQGALERGSLPVHLVDEERSRELVLHSQLPHHLVLDFHPVHGRDHEQDRVHRPERRADVADEVGVSRGVEDVELGVAPLDGGERQGDADLTLDLLGLEVADGVPVLDGSHPSGGSSQEDQCLCEGCLATAAVADEKYVADVGCFVGVQLSSPVGGSRL
jgi:hypothetical protein